MNPENNQQVAETVAPKNNVDHLPYLDGWRGCAIVALLIGHFARVPGLNLGRAGVELFFVLSGRLMAEILFVREFPLGQFFKRRFARIWPALLIFTLIITIVTAQVTWLDALKALTFTINYFSGNRFIHHVWSLCVEEHSYIILALVAWIVRHWKFNALNICLALALACIINGMLQSFLLDEYSYYVVYWRTDVRAGSIFLAVSAYLYFREKTIPGWFPVVCGVAGMMFQVNFLPDFIKYSIGSALLAVSVATLGKAKEWLILILGNRILTIAGTFSYSIYLWQQPFYKSGGLRLLPLALICAVLSFYLIEKPARRFIVNFKWFGTSRT